MPTKKPRINIVLDPKLYKALTKLAHDEGLSVSLVARDLIKDAFEIYEDKYWDKKAGERDKTFKSERALTHGEIWD